MGLSPQLDERPFIHSFLLMENNRRLAEGEHLK